MEVLLEEGNGLLYDLPIEGVELCGLAGEIKPLGVELSLRGGD